jgi:hypothetical protein
MSEEEAENHFLPPYRKYVDEYDENLTKELVAVLNRFSDQYVPSEDMEKGCVKRFWEYVKDRWDYEYEYYEVPLEESDDEEEEEW